MANTAQDATQDSGYKWLVLMVVGVGTFMAALDGSIVNIVIPMIQRTYGATIGTVSWVSTAYLLVISSLLLTFGRLGDLLGFKKVYSTGYVVFGLGSVFCALAPTLGWLVVARVVQGIGAAILMALGPALVTTAFPGTERGRALGMQGTLTYLGLTVGPSLGGFIAGHFGWHWVFWINLPVSAMGALLAFTRLRPGKRMEASFDLVGAALLGVGLTALLLGLSQGENWGWTSKGVLSLLAVGLLALVLFVVQESRTQHPMMPLWLLRIPVVGLSTLTAFLSYAVTFMLTFLLPFYLQQFRALPTDQVGLVMTAQPAAMVLLAAAAGWISDRVGPRIPATAGLLLMATGFLLISRSGATVALPTLMLFLATSGVGAGLFTSPNNSALMGGAPRDRQGIASGLLAISRNVGMVTGIAAASSLFAYWRGALLGSGMAAGPAFLTAFQRTLLTAAVIAAVAAGISAVRPSGEMR